MTSRPRIVLFGPFDRHNLGDLLFAQVLRALLPKRELGYAGLARRDLRAFGGVKTQPLSELIQDQAPLHLIHAGGETLSCEAWEAAAMLLPPEDARAATARYGMATLTEQNRWAKTQIGVDLRAPYVLPKHLFRQPGVFVHNAVGGVALAERDPDFQTEVAASLRSADFVGVRDHLSHATLARLGIAAVLMPDAVVMVQTLFGARIDLHAQTGEVARARAACAAGYIAAQFSLDFADDATQRALAAALDQLHLQTGFTIVLFRAGAAPLHDDLAMYRALAARMHHTPLIFESIQLWEICALIAHSRLFCGSSLHGRIVALAYGLPRASVLPPPLVPGQASKIAAMIKTWEPDHRATLTQVNGLAHAAQIALALAPANQQALAASLCAHYQAGFRQWQALLE
ncbi:MAG: polysaccharide pyruvyl transferase family protein [Burkholderiales bacterium]|nr:polysaccharide pyruvyl transferase family protein [Burkholderiales bacterium]